MKRLPLVMCCLLLASAAVAGDWPAWRGPLGTGVSDEKNVPLTWSKDENIKWKVTLEGPGNSTPIVAGSRVFVSSSPAKTKLRGLICLDRNTGKELWKQQVEAEELEATHATNPYCASSPVTDGKRVYAWHGIAGLHCYDMDGKELWKKDLGKVEHIWGYGSSPVLFKDLLILNFGPGVNAFVVALNKESGDEVWRKEYPQQKSKTEKEYRGSWSTPVIYEEKGQPLMLLSLPQRLFAVDPQTGEEVWSCGGLKDLIYTSPLVAGEAIVTMGGFHSPALGVRSGGKGDVTETHRLWHHEARNPQRVGSGVAVGDYVYIMNEPGNTVCLDAKTGETKWEQRVGNTGNNWSSMCYADGRLYIVNRDGVTYVLEPNPQECKILAENDIGRELTRASLAISDGQIFLRTHENLYCIEAKK